MSARADKIHRLGIDVSGSISGSLSIAAKFLGIGIQQPGESVDSAATDTINVSNETQHWFSSIVGAFDGDPSYAEIIENMRESERRLAAEIDAIE